MTSVRTMARLRDYDRTVYGGYARRVLRVRWDEATRDRGLAHGRFKDTLVQLLNVREAWLIAAPSDDRRCREEPSRRLSEIRSRREFDAYRPRGWTGVGRLATHLTKGQLHRRIRVPWMAGRYHLEDGIFQASFEQAHHLGEMFGAFWKLG